MSRRKISSGTRWEPLVGYSRAVRTGSLICVSGTTATDGNGQIVGIGDPGAQMRQCLLNIQAALRQLGSGLRHVVRTRIYVTDIEAWREIGAVHGEFFSETRPASCMVEVSRLIEPEILVEVEADAWVD